MFSIHHHATRVIDAITFGLLIAAAILVPWAVDNSVTNSFALSKLLVSAGLCLLALLVFAVKIVFSKKIILVRSFLDFPLLGLLVAAFLSALWSVARGDSFWGNNSYLVISFALLLSSVIWYFVCLNTISTVRRWESLVHAIVLVGGTSALVFILKAVWHWDVLNYLVGSALNPVDIANSAFGVWLIVIFVLAAGKLISRSLPAAWLLIYFFIALLTFVSLVLLGFTIIWWLLLLALALLLALGITLIKVSRVGWLSVLFILFLITALLLAFGPPKNFQNIVPSEVVLNGASSWLIARDTVLFGVKNFLLGSGLGTFGIDFSQFRDVSVNNDALAWSLRFHRPQSSLVAILAEGGVLTLFPLLIIILLVLGHIAARFRQLKKATRELPGSDGGSILEPSSQLDVFLVALAWIVLSVSLLVTFFGVVLWWLWFVLLALTAIGIALSGGEPLRGHEFAIADTPQYRLMFSFVMIVVLCAVIISGIYGLRLYFAERHYTKALASQDYKIAEEEVKTAISYRGNYAAYHTGLAQAYLLQAIVESRVAKPDLEKVGKLLGQAVVTARFATALSPRTVALWENLTVMYENAALFVPGARSLAINTLIEARDLEPTNPFLAWRLGNNYALASEWSNATKLFQEAINLKKDYAPAYVGLSVAYEQANNLDKAITTYQTVYALLPNDVDILYNFGRLLYNRAKNGDRDNAEKLWQQVLALQADNSNALYSLGLLSESRGAKARALEYYYQVKKLNPQNQDVITKINSLVGGPALPATSTP
ncbi:MAG: tetratricopeptide repeat protein [Candidatus Magasanikbacteria bacterium]|nr:tetratricopeptide repeat protein [Candidatus Magasanikbacteria bacterium]